jgi:ABC-type branched-subunit amino acid transport system permease subunit
VTIYASLYLLVEVSGQISLCHVTFVAIGATTFCHLTTGAGLPWLVGVVGAMIVAVPVGAIVAVPAIRLSGLFLALATFGFGVLVEQIVYPRGVMFGDLLARQGHRPALFGLDGGQRYFYLCMAIGAASVAVVIALRRSQLGRLLDALADSPTALLTHGASINITRVLVFCISASMAALGGALYVGVTGSVSGSGVSPGALVSFNSLLWLAVLAVVGRNAVVAPVLAAILLVVAPSYSTNPDTAQYLTILFGAAALLSATFAEDIGRWMTAVTPAGRDRVVRSPVRDRTIAAATPDPAGA